MESIEMVRRLCFLFILIELVIYSQNNEVSEKKNTTSQSMKIKDSPFSLIRENHFVL